MCIRFRTLMLAAIALALLAPLPSRGQPAPPPSNLRVEQIPPIPQDLLAEVDSYSEYRTASFSSWHPTKREILISTRFGNVPQLHTVSMPGGARNQITFFPEPVTSGDYQPGTGRYIAFTKDVGGAEFYQIFLYDTQSGKNRMISDGKSRNGSLKWSPSGKLLAFTSTRRTGKDFDVYVMDPQNSASPKLVYEASGGHSFSTADWSPDESKLLILDYRSITDCALDLLDLKTGERRRLTPAKDGEDLAVGDAEFSADGKSVYYTSDQGANFKSLRKQGVSGGPEEIVIASASADVEDFTLSPGDRHLAYTFNVVGESQLRIRELISSKELSVPPIPKGTLGGLEWHPSGSELAFTSNNSRGTNAYSLTISGELKQWTQSELGGLVPEQLAEPEVIRWKSFDGLEISGFLYKPAARFAGKRPVMISIHGGPEGQSRPGFQGSRNYFLNELGVALIYPNVRGSSGFGKQYVSLDNGRLREDSVKDIGALLDYIGGRNDLDSERVMVSGGSYGGYMVLAAMTFYNARLRCAIDVVGISNFVTFLSNTQDYRRNLRRAEYGDESEQDMREFLERISPLTNAAKITKPMLVVQGKNDPRVPVTESLQMVEKIRKNGGSVWYLEASDEGHGFRKKSNRDFQMAAEVLFLKAHLLN